MCAGAGRRSRFRRKVLEGSGRFRRVPACAGVCSRGGFRKVPERVPACAGVGSGGGFRKVPESSGVKWCRFRRRVPESSGESSGVCWCRFRRRVPEGSGEFRCETVWVLEASSGRFRRVPVYAGIGSGGRFRKVSESSGVVCCLATL